MATIKSVLVIEDDQAIRESLRELLESEGYAVVLAEHGLMGLQLLVEQKLEPSVILVDLSMPVMDGHAFLNVMKTEHADIKVPTFVMTAAGTSAFPKDHDPKRIIKKPINVDGLMDILDGLFR